MRPNYSYARKMARRVIKDYRIKSVPVDLIKIFDALKYKIVELNDPDDIDGMILKIKGQPLVAVINTAKPIQRQRFTLAHELGHIFLSHEQRDMYDAETSREEADTIPTTKPPKEIEADVFASELLIPFEYLKQYHDQINDIDKLMQVFQVSKTAMFIAIENYLKYSHKLER